MYIPLAYWNTQGDAYPTMTLSLFSIPLGIRDLKYTYEGTATTSSFSGGALIQNYCADIYNASDLQNEINSVTSFIASPLYFCSAAPSTSVRVVDCTNYTFTYGGTGCPIGGAATAEYYDCSGNRQLETVYWNAPITRCVSGIVDRTCILESQVSTASCGTNTTFTSSQCCVSEPPNTGPEAWYFDVTYNTLGGTDRGPFYYNYINQFGQIVNDSIGFGQTKRIVAQAAPLVSRSSSDTFQYYINWTAVERYPGDVIEYPLKNVAASYTLQLKRDDTRTPGNYRFPDITLSALTLNTGSGDYEITNKGQFLQGFAFSASLNVTHSFTSADVPIDNNDNLNDLGNTVWIISATRLNKQRYIIGECNTTASYVVTFTGSYSPSIGASFTTTTSPLQNKCLVVTGFTNDNATVDYALITTGSVYNNCFECTYVPSIPSGSVAVTGSLFALYDVANTSSYNGVGDTIYNLAWYSRNATMRSGSSWLYDSSSLATKTLKLINTGSIVPGIGNNSLINCATTPVSGSYSLLLSMYGSNLNWELPGGQDIMNIFATNPTNAGFGGVDGLRMGQYFGQDGTMYSLISQLSGGGTKQIGGFGAITANVWRVYQVSYNGITNTVNWAINGLTGSYTASDFGYNSNFDFALFGATGDVGYGSNYFGTGSMFQVAAIYTGSLSTTELQQNWNSLKGRYGY
jgi:hypothetical protein